jgi:hypothetical protein
MAVWSADAYLFPRFNVAKLSGYQSILHATHQHLQIIVIRTRVYGIITNLVIALYSHPNVLPRLKIESFALEPNDRRGIREFPNFENSAGFSFLTALQHNDSF